MPKLFASFLLVFGVHAASPPIILGSSQKLGVTRATFSLSFSPASNLLPSPRGLYIFEICPFLSAPLPLPDARYLPERTTTVNCLTGLSIYVLSPLQSILHSAAKITIQNKNLVKFSTTPSLIKMFQILPITFKIITIIKWVKIQMK